MTKRIYLLVSVIILALSFWQLKPILDIPKAKFVETPTATPVTQKPLFSFSVIGDPESDLPNLKKALAISKSNGDEFTVIVGDLTHVGSEKELREVKKVLDESGLKYYAVPGNHDLYSAKKLANDPTKYYQEIIGRPFDKVLVNEKLTLLLIDNSDEDEGISAEQMEFINEILSPNKGNIFIFLHIPVYHPESTYIMGYSNADVSKQKDELLNILKEASVSAIFAGHLHHTSSYEWSGIKFFVAGSVNSLRNWQTPRFLEVKVYKDKNLTASEMEL